ncbi:MAG TPA: RNA 2',3'-cyclic phosphodiesterase [Thermomicrobiales bacterium]|nr:RNA 2',3'-cyclic phosphodiesterase [Thermomicrobiales bacterium]
MTSDEQRNQPRRGPSKRQQYRKERPAPETVDTDWRLFIAIPMPQEVRDRLRRLIDRLEPEGWPMRWVDPDNAHLTLHFLGDTPPEQAEILRLALGPIVGQHPAFDLRTAGLGVFPKLKRPRVLWLGVWGPTHRLESIYNNLGDALDNLQFPIEERPFSPHITLGRGRGGSNVPIRDLPEKLRAAIDTMAAEGLADPQNGLPLPIEEVLLMRSHLNREGPRYEVIERFPLAPRDADGD